MRANLFRGRVWAIRIVGEVTAARLDTLRRADAIAREELTAAGLDNQIWQCPVVLLADIRSVGVQGDGRTYGHPIVLRPVSSEDAMTADWTRVPYEVLERISTRITNEVRRGQPGGAGRHQQAAGHHRVGVALVRTNSPFRRRRCVAAFHFPARLDDKSAGNIEIAIVRDQDQGAVGGADRAPAEPVVCSRIGRERIAEACDVDLGHGDSDRVGCRRMLRQIGECQHRFLVELVAQRFGGGMQRGLVGAAQMEIRVHAHSCLAATYLTSTPRRAGSIPSPPRRLVRSLRRLVISNRGSALSVANSSAG